MAEGININKYLPIVLIYFFFNSFLLPNGLLYTTILTPFFFIWIYRHRNYPPLVYLILLLIPFISIHFYNGVQPKPYFISLTLLLSVAIFSITVYQFLQICKSLRKIYRTLLIWNFFACILAIIGLLVPVLKDRLWTDANISAGIEGLNRLQLLTYEPSFYSTLMVPLALYYYLKLALGQLKSPTLVIIYITLPLILSFSMGVLVSLALAMVGTMMINITSFFSRHKLALYIIGGVILSIVALSVLFIFFPDNLVFKRFSNVFEGRDTSFKGRTFDAFYLAWKVAEMKNTIWGSGLGQTKLLGVELWNEYYRHIFTSEQIAVPNAIADTLAVFGLSGVIIRLLAEIYFFFKTKVYRNNYQLALFLFIFIYQFTGSFIFNIAEYVIWVLAFSNVFEEFNTKKYSKHIQ